MASIIFDFDGTIADSFEYFIAFVTKEADIPELTEAQKAAFHGLSMARVCRRLGIPWHRLPGMFFKGRRQMRRAMKKVEPFTGMPEVIKQLHKDGHDLYMLSTNATPNIHRFLRYQKLEEYFKEVYGGVGMFGKAPALRRLLREQHIENRKAVYIGDEIRDVMAAQSLGVKVVAVTWGFARALDLKAEGATGVAEKPEDIPEIIGKLSYR